MPFKGKGTPLTGHRVVAFWVRCAGDDPPREYSYTPGYYAVFFADPDGMKLELVNIPG